jgi:hypothetical protein
MEIAEFRRNFPPAEAVPQCLIELLEFQNRSREWYSDHFELVPWPYGEAAWFGGDVDTAKQFVVFGHGPDGSLYALWHYRGRMLANAPVVFLGSEGTDCGLLADNIDAFLGLLAIGADELGFAAASGEVRPSPKPARRLDEFRGWVQRSFGILPPKDPMVAVEAARLGHPDFASWLQTWLREH